MTQLSLLARQGPAYPNAMSTTMTDRPNAKRTEKIEIRVSTEEKEAVAAIAQASGTSASDVIRRQLDDAIERHRSTEREPQMTVMSKLGWSAMGAVIATGLIGAGWAMSRHGPADTYEIRVEAGTVGRQTAQLSIDVQSSLPLSADLPAVLHTPGDGRDGIVVEGQLQRAEQGTLALALSFCFRVENACVWAAEPKTIVGAGQEGLVSLGSDDRYFRARLEPRPR